jgi:hypothetical protein
MLIVESMEALGGLSPAFIHNPVELDRHCHWRIYVVYKLPKNVTLSGSPAMPSQGASFTVLPGQCQNSNLAKCSVRGIY